MQNHGLEENLCPNVTLVFERTLKLLCGQDHFFGEGWTAIIFSTKLLCFLKTVDRLDVLGREGHIFGNLILHYQLFL